MISHDLGGSSGGSSGGSGSGTGSGSINNGQTSGNLVVEGNLAGSGLNSVPWIKAALDGNLKIPGATDNR